MEFRFHRAGILCFGLIILAGCATSNPSFPSDARRAESFRPHQNLTLNDRPLAVVLIEKTAVICNGISMDAAEARGRDLAVQGAPTSTNAPMAMSGLAMAMSGLAMAIAPDGYFLTAAHLTTNGPIQLFFWTSQGPQAARARVVASRLSRKPWMDVAVIHVDAKLPAVFEWCDARELAAGRPLIEVGASSKVIAGECLRFRRACLAGKVKAVSASAKGISLIKSDLTSRAGDSGGPVVTPSGKLAGVHSGVSSSLFGAAGVSIRPAPGWVADVIAADRLVSPPDAPPVLARHIDESWAWMLISF